MAEPEHRPIHPSRPAPAWKPGRRRRLLRRAGFYWVAMAALAAATALGVSRITSHAAALRDGYGSTAPALVATTPILAGEFIAPAVEVRDVPVMFLPDDALGEVGPNATAAHGLGAGTIVTAQAIDIGATIGETDVAIAVPVGPTTPRLAPGQPVLVMVHADPFAGVDAGQIEGSVLETSADQILVVVPRDSAATLAMALNGGGVTIAMVP